MVDINDKSRRKKLDVDAAKQDSFDMSELPQPVTLSPKFICPDASLVVSGHQLCC